MCQQLARATIPSELIERSIDLPRPQIHSLQCQPHTRFTLPHSQGGKLLFSTVPQDFEKAYGHVIIVHQRHHFAARPKTITILTQVPTLVESVPRQKRIVHFLCGKIGRPILRRKKLRTGTPAHFVFGPPQNTMGALVPACDKSLQIHCHDAVIQSTFENEPVPSFGCAVQYRHAA